VVVLLGDAVASGVAGSVEVGASGVAGSVEAGVAGVAGSVEVGASGAVGSVEAGAAGVAGAVVACEVGLWVRGVQPPPFHRSCRDAFCQFRPFFEPCR
jgi:hypothetical protein